MPCVCFSSVFRWGEKFYEVFTSLQCVLGPEKFSYVVIRLSGDAAAAGVGSLCEIYGGKSWENFGIYDVMYKNDALKLFFDTYLNS